MNSLFNIISFSPISEQTNYCWPDRFWRIRAKEQNADTEWSPKGNANVSQRWCIRKLKLKSIKWSDKKINSISFIYFTKKEIILPRKFRTVTSGIPTIESGKKHENGNGNGNLQENGATNGKEKEPLVGSLLTRQALKTYETANHMVFYKYSVYGGSCGDLPR